MHSCLSQVREGDQSGEQQDYGVATYFLEWLVGMPPPLPCRLVLLPRVPPVPALMTLWYDCLGRDFRGGCLGPATGRGGVKGANHVPNFDL